MLNHLSLLLLTLALVASGWRRAETATAPAARPTLTAAVQQISRTTYPHVVPVPATIRPAQRAVVAAQVTGTLREFPVILGQTVSAGALLARIATPEIEARLAQAKAQLAEAERVVARERGLSGTGANALDSVKDAESRLRVTQAAVAEAEAQVAHSTLRAPFAGSVVETYVLSGDLATPGKPLLVLEAVEQLRAEGALPESLARGLRAGDPMNVRAAGQLIQGRIVELSSAADPVTRGQWIKVGVPTDKVRSGQLVELLPEGPTTTGLFVPSGAVHVSGQMERLFVLHEGRAQLRLIRTGREQAGMVEVVSGLGEGETIIMGPTTALRDGDQVMVKP